eukprot:1746332-Pleurochrysis_carterae.AAC.2
MGPAVDTFVLLIAIRRSSSCSSPSTLFAIFAPQSEVVLACNEKWLRCAPHASQRLIGSSRDLIVLVFTPLAVLID